VENHNRTIRLFKEETEGPVQPTEEKKGAPEEEEERKGVACQQIIDTGMLVVVDASGLSVYICQ